MKSSFPLVLSGNGKSFELRRLRMIQVGDVACHALFATRRAIKKAISGGTAVYRYQPLRKTCSIADLTGELRATSRRDELWLGCCQFVKADAAKIRKWAGFRSARKGSK